MVSNDSVLTKTLVLEIALPTFYAEDIAADSEQWQEWLRMVDVDADDPGAVGDEILRNIGEVYHGLLTIEVSGEKDSETIRTPVLMVGARVEDRPPEPEEEWKDTLDDFAERIDEPAEETRVLHAMDRAELRVLNRFVRQIRDEYTGQVSELAAQAIQEARLASDEAERKETR